MKESSLLKQSSSVVSKSCTGRQKDTVRTWKIVGIVAFVTFALTAGAEMAAENIYKSQVLKSVFLGAALGSLITVIIQSIRKGK